MLSIILISRLISSSLVFKRFLIAIVFVFLFNAGLVGAAFFQSEISLNGFFESELEKLAVDIKSTQNLNRTRSNEIAPLPSVSTNQAKNNLAVQIPIKANPPSSEAKTRIKAEPPKQTSALASGRTTEVIKEGDAERTIVSEGTSNKADYQRIAGYGASSTGSPLEIRFRDETGDYPNLAGTLKNYLNSTLKWGNEIPSLREVVIRDVGDTGWSGQYHGSYIKESNGNIGSAWGWIILNVHYKKDSPYFDDYMKVTFAHEYGHHFSLYHKWVDLDLGADKRFPESYYETRPLPVQDVSLDCSLSWQNCESEIVAEDYAYLFSGYNYHAMQAKYGLPADPAMRRWFDEFVINSKTVSGNTPPRITIISPTASGSTSGKFNFQVEVTDDRGVSKVQFLRNNDLLKEDDSPPYELWVDLSTLLPGDYEFKAKAYDIDGAVAEKTFSATITNPETGQTSNLNQGVGNLSTNSSRAGVSTDSEKPIISFLEPKSNPYTWEQDDLIIKIRGSDNVTVRKIELYINGTLMLEGEGEVLNARWSFADGDPGTYELKALIYDTAGNQAETALVVNKK